MPADWDDTDHVDDRRGGGAWRMTVGIPAATFRLRGDIEAADAGGFRAQVAAFVDGCDGGAEMVFDCSELEFIDSRGLAVLLDAAFDLERRGRAFRIASTSAHLAGVLRIAHIAEALHLDESAA